MTDPNAIQRLRAFLDTHEFVGDTDIDAANEALADLEARITDLEAQVRLLNLVREELLNSLTAAEAQVAATETTRQALAEAADALAADARAYIEDDGHGEQGPALAALDALVARITDLEAEERSRSEKFTVRQTFQEHVDRWLESNHKKPADVMWARFPLGMVGLWINRAVAAEAQVAATHPTGALVGRMKRSPAETASHLRLIADEMEAAGFNVPASVATIRHAAARITDLEALYQAAKRWSYLRDIGDNSDDTLRADEALAAAVRQVEGQ